MVSIGFRIFSCLEQLWVLKASAKRWVVNSTPHLQPENLNPQLDIKGQLYHCFRGLNAEMLFELSRTGIWSRGAERR